MLICSCELPSPYHLEAKQILNLGLKWIGDSKNKQLKKEDFYQIVNKKSSVIDMDGETVEFGYIRLEPSGGKIGGSKKNKKNKKGGKNKKIKKNQNNIQHIAAIAFSKEEGSDLVSMQLNCEPSHISARSQKSIKPHFINHLLKQVGSRVDEQFPESDKILIVKSNHILPIVHHNMADSDQLAAKLADTLKDLIQSRPIGRDNLGVYWSKGGGQKSYYLPELIKDSESLLNKIKDDMIASLTGGKSDQDVDLSENHTDGGNENIAEYIESFDREIENLKENLVLANGEIARLQAEIYRLESLQLSHSTGILTIGKERDLYKFEIRSFVLEALKRHLEMGVLRDSRCYHVLNDLIESNSLSVDFRLEKKEQLKRIFNDYTKMTPVILGRLKEIGFSHSDDGKHHRFVFAGDSRYTATTSKTSSDYRAGKNFARDVANKIF